jgi:hypothetical protein
MQFEKTRRVNIEDKHHNFLYRSSKDGKKPELQSDRSLGEIVAEHASGLRKVENKYSQVHSNDDKSRMLGNLFPLKGKKAITVNKSIICMEQRHEDNKAIQPSMHDIVSIDSSGTSNPGVQYGDAGRALDDQIRAWAIERNEYEECEGDGYDRHTQRNVRSASQGTTRVSSAISVSTRSFSCTREKEAEQENSVVAFSNQNKIIMLPLQTIIDNGTEAMLNRCVGESAQDEDKHHSMKYKRSLKSSNIMDSKGSDESQQNVNHETVSYSQALHGSLVEDDTSVISDLDPIEYHPSTMRNFQYTKKESVNLIYDSFGASPTSLPRDSPSHQNIAITAAGQIKSTGGRDEINESALVLRQQEWRKTVDCAVKSEATKQTHWSRPSILTETNDMLSREENPHIQAFASDSYARPNSSEIAVFCQGKWSIISNQLATNTLYEPSEGTGMIFNPEYTLVSLNRDKKRSKVKEIPSSACMMRRGTNLRRKEFYTTGRRDPSWQRRFTSVPILSWKQNFACVGVTCSKSDMSFIQRTAYDSRMREVSKGLECINQQSLSSTLVQDLGLATFEENGLNPSSCLSAPMSVHYSLHDRSQHLSSALSSRTEEIRTRSLIVQETFDSKDTFFVNESARSEREASSKTTERMIGDNYQKHDLESGDFSSTSVSSISKVVIAPRHGVMLNEGCFPPDPGSFAASELQVLAIQSREQEGIQHTAQEFRNAANTIKEILNGQEPVLAEHLHSSHYAVADPDRARVTIKSATEEFRRIAGRQATIWARGSALSIMKDDIPAHPTSADYHKSNQVGFSFYKILERPISLTFFHFLY